MTSENDVYIDVVRAFRVDPEWFNSVAACAWNRIQTFGLHSFVGEGVLACFRHSSGSGFDS